MHIHEGFQQTPYTLPPAAWDSEHALQGILRRTLPPAIYAALDEDLKAFQVRLAGPIRQAALLADEVEPSVVQFDQWGRRVDLLRTSEGWRKLKDISAQEGCVATFMERKDGEHSRSVGFAKVSFEDASIQGRVAFNVSVLACTQGFLLAPDARMVGCPYSMTDGCARVLELAGTPEMKREVLPRLMSRDAREAWTSGQWMTERPGGSDVSLSETVARPEDPSRPAKAGDTFVLDGFKWFSSATDGDVSLALARTGDVKGSRGLSLFLVRMRDEQGGSNGIHIHRLKRKYGTKVRALAYIARKLTKANSRQALPTAELSLNNCKGQLIGSLGQGIPIIATVLNITRLHSAIHSASSLSRSLAIAKAFARVRRIGGDPGSLLSANPMHTSTLLQTELISRALTQFVFGQIRLMGKAEALGDEGMTEGERWRLRLLTPVVKAFNSHLAVQEMPCVMECLGGQGYMVENEIGRTTNVLALDVVRVILKSKGVAWAESTIINTPSSSKSITKPSLDILTSSLATLSNASAHYSGPTAPDPMLSRHILFLLGYLTTSIHFLEQLTWSAKTPGEDASNDVEVFTRWVGAGELEATAVKIKGMLARAGSARARLGAVERLIVYGPGEVNLRDSKL
ncbi:hypothetical protein P7C70_g7221, partial [Phenoliferia sp. Uapishka_3]